MSLINSMLQDLDRRRALGPEADSAGVRAPTVKPKGREWFWYTLALLMTLSVSWVGWVAFQVVPHPWVTKLALSVPKQLRAPEVRRPEVRVPPSPIVQVSAPAPTIEAAVPVQPATPVQPAPAEPVPALTPSPRFETLRLALELEKAPAVSEPQPPMARMRPAKQVIAQTEPAKAPTRGTIDKFDRTQPAPQTTSNNFTRAVALLNQGRLSEAEQQLTAALKADPSHAAARQAYVALLLEQQRVDAARRVLQDGLALAPAHAEFALALARIHTQRREYAAALQVMDKSGDAAANTEFQALRGAVLQRLGRHAEAVDAYQNALRATVQPATTWLGLGISLEALGRKPEATQAYRRALSAGPLASEAREYAETRVRAIQ
jgi:MSHA biogenesis protein MshN